MSIRIGVDAMGGDHAPSVIVRGALLALADANSPVELVLVGQQALVAEVLVGVNMNGLGDRVSVVHAEQVVGADESPVQALRSKKDSSLSRLVDLAASGEIQAVLSAGNTGAFAAACQLRLRPLPGVSRPGIAVTLPSVQGPVLLCDAGANVQPKPRHLYEYALMASVYAERILGRPSPRVGLLSIGEESGKGTGLVKQAHALLDGDDSIHYVGNVEGQELFENRCDVAVCDGFVGNVVLKLAEGLAEALFRSLREEFGTEAEDVRRRVNGALERAWERHDYSQYGGAPLLGVDGVAIICHGRSNEVAVCNAVRVARRFVEQNLNEAIVARLAQARHQDAIA